MYFGPGEVVEGVLGCEPGFLVGWLVWLGVGGGWGEGIPFVGNYSVRSQFKNVETAIAD